MAFSITYLFKARQNFGVSLIIHKVLGSFVRPVFYLALALRSRPCVLPRMPMSIAETSPLLIAVTDLRRW